MVDPYTNTLAIVALANKHTKTVLSAKLSLSGIHYFLSVRSELVLGDLREKSFKMA